MNQVQLAIVGLVAVIVLVIIGYYIYQENKFKKIVEKNFNQSTNDVLDQEKGIVFENQAEGNLSSFQTSERSVEFIQVETKPSKSGDTDFDALLDGAAEVVNPVANTLFAKYEEKVFPYADKVSAEFDHVIDVYFPKSIKLKALPEVAQFTNKTINIYILEKNIGWSLYERGKKYQIDGIKVVSNIIDSDGLVTSLQLNNIYNEFNNFANHNDGIIRQNDLELELRRIQQQVKHLVDLQLELELFLLNKEPVEIRQLDKYLVSSGFTNWNGVYKYSLNGKTIFEIRDEKGNPLAGNTQHQVLSILSKLHHQENPLSAINEIFDFAENYMQYFESRILSTNRMLMTEKEFSALDRQVKNYVNQCNRKGVVLGSEIILRVLP